MKDDGERFISKIDGPESLGSAICNVTQACMKATAEATGGSGPAITKMAMAACLATLSCGAMALGKKKPDASPQDQAVYTVTPESVLFTALMAAAQMQDGPPITRDNDEVGVVATFGPTTFGVALDHWQKIYPDRKIEDFVEAGVATIARENLAKIDAVPKFDGKRGFVFPNNGTIN